MSPSEAQKSALEAFASQLKAWRQLRGWGQRELASEVGYSPSLVASIETCERNPTAAFAQKCDAVFRTPQTFTVFRGLIAREAYPSWFAPVVSLERDATRIHAWQPGVIPGLLQTEGYARSVIAARQLRKDKETVESDVQARIERQAILAKEGAPFYWCVLDEAVLRHLIGGRDTMSEQLGKLLECAETATVTLQIFPLAAHDHPGVEGPIVVYETGTTSMAYTECHGGGRVVENEEEVAELMMMVNLLRAGALNPRDSASLIEQIRREL